MTDAQRKIRFMRAHWESLGYWVAQDAMSANPTPIDNEWGLVWVYYYRGGQEH